VHVLRVIKVLKFTIDDILVAILWGWSVGWGRGSGYAVNVVQMLLDNLRRTEFDKEIHTKKKYGYVIERTGDIKGGYDVNNGGNRNEFIKDVNPPVEHEPKDETRFDLYFIKKADVWGNTWRFLIGHIAIIQQTLSPGDTELSITGSTKESYPLTGS
jgi:hypothetical protein